MEQNVNEKNNAPGRVMKKIYLILGITVVILASIQLALSMLIQLGRSLGVKFPVLQLTEIVNIFIYLFPLTVLLILGIYLIHLRKSEHASVRRVTAVAALVSAVILILASPICVWKIWTSNPVLTKTEDPEDYLVLSDSTETELSKARVNIFPKEIPEGGNKVVYYYYCSNELDPEHEIFAEWVLSSKDLEAELERITELGEPSRTFTLEDHTYLEFEENNVIANALNDYTCYFTYSEETGTVRYVFYSNFDRKNTPYSERIKW